MFNGVIIVGTAEVEQPDKSLAVALQRQVAQLVGQRQCFFGILQSFVVALRGPEMLACPIPNEHVDTVGGRAVG